LSFGSAVGTGDLIGTAIGGLEVGEDFGRTVGLGGATGATGGHFHCNVSVSFG
jgi:hypothetical protein